MEKLTGRSRIVSNKKLSFWESIYLPAIVGGMFITIKHFFRKKVTINFPEQTRIRSDVYRGRHVLKRDDEGRERCTACGLCALSCPAEAITMTAAERKPEEEHLYREEKYAIIYQINMLRCIFCGDCEDACPKEAIFLTDRLVDSEYKRSIFVYGKELLTEPFEIEKRIDVSKRQTPEVINFKKNKKFTHNK